MSEWILRQRLTRWGIVCLVLVVLATFMVLTGWGRAAALPVEPSVAPSASIYAIPGSDGASVYIGAGRLGQMTTPVYVYINYQVGPTLYERVHTMVYDAGSREYSHTFEGLFNVGMTVEGTINISTTVNPSLGSSHYVRHYVPGTYAVDLPSSDGWLNLHISAGGVPTDTYVIIMTTNVPPGNPPPGHRLTGQSCAIQASGALTESLKPMTLRMSYETAWLAGADPHTLSLFAWDTGGRRWIDLGGTAFFDWYNLEQTVRQFTTYALMTTTTWRDTFGDIYGLSERHDVRLAYGGKLELASGATSGWAVSVPITPTGSFVAWDQLTYSAVITSGTTLTVSVLDGRTGEELLPNVASGASLAAIDPLAHPSLRLRATLSADVPGKTPSLEEWIISWTPATARRKLYLPLITARAGEQESRRAREQGSRRDSPPHSGTPAPLHAHSSGPPLGCEPAPTPAIEWSAPVNISDNAGTSLSPALAIDVTGTLHAVWYDNSFGNLDILYASRDVGGAGWAPPVNVSNTSGSSYWPAISVDGQGNVHVAWDDSSSGRDILYTMKLAGGTGWTEPVNISRSPGTARFASLATDSAGNIHAAWCDDTPGNYEIYYAQGGATWTSPTVIASTPGTSWAPAIAVDGSDTVHVAWHDFTPGPTEIYYAMKPVGGSWSSPVNASHTTGASYFPTLAADSSGTAHLA